MRQFPVNSSAPVTMTIVRPTGKTHALKKRPSAAGCTPQETTALPNAPNAIKAPANIASTNIFGNASSLFLLPISVYSVSISVGDFIFSS